MNTKQALVIISIATLVSAGAAFYHKNQSDSYRESLENSYRRAFIELVDYTGNMDVLLNKAAASNDKTQLAEISQQLWSETALAKSALSQLPLTSSELERTSAFITQVSDYVHTINTQMMHDQPLNDEIYQHIETLVEYSDGLNNDLKEVETRFIDGTMRFSSQQLKTAMADNSLTNINETFSAVEKSFENYPTIIYDGPFSEHILNRKAEVLNQPGIDSEYALTVAEKFVGKNLNFSGESKGNIPSYIFSTEDGSICIEISKNGGKPVMFTNSKVVNNPQITVEQASDYATSFLSDKGYASMEQTGYTIEGNTVNFAYAQMLDGFKIYSDLLKIKVSLHDGTVCGFEAHGYLSNHKWRKAPTPTISKETAIAGLSPNLKVIDTTMACIPKNNGSECWCYEIKASYNDKIFLVYVNILTGNEEEILLYVEDSNGSLTV